MVLAEFISVCAIGLRASVLPYWLEASLSTLPCGLLQHGSLLHQNNPNDKCVWGDTHMHMQRQRETRRVRQKERQRQGCQEDRSYSLL